MFRMHLFSVVATPQLLAHQGGWDEMLMVVVPVGVFAALLYVANKRAAKLADHTHEGDGSPLSRDIDPRNDRGGPR
jgi:hypothetical protein